MSDKSALEKKFQKITYELGDQTAFYMDDIQTIFPDMKRSSLYWYISKMVEAGLLKRVRNGTYALNEWHGKKAVTLSNDAKRIQNIMDELGFEYYVSGLDILAKYMLHVPEQYPIMIFVEKEAYDEISGVLQQSEIEVIKPVQLQASYENHVYTGQNNTQAVVYLTENFAYSENRLATTEKAFLDLYYAITRNGYPLALQELVRIYENVTRLGNLDKKKLITVATRRSLQYDIRFIVESKYINTEAMRFVELLRKDE